MVADPVESSRIIAISEVPALTAGTTSLIYGLIDPNKLVIRQIHSPLSVKFYYQDPFYIINSPDTDWFSHAILKEDVNNPKTDERFIRRFNLSYFVENREIINKFSITVQQTKDNIYDNGKSRIWMLT